MFIGCKSTYNPRDTWQNALSQCASDDLLSSKNKKNLLFLGLSNVMGPGSVWRYDSTNHGYEPRWAIEKAITNVSDRKTLFNPSGASPNCSVNFSVSKSAQIKALFNVDTLKVGAGANIALDKSTSMQITFNKWHKDIIDEVAYETWIQQAYQQNAYAKDVLKANRMVMKSAIWVEGFNAKIKIDSKLLDSISAKADLRSAVKAEGNLTVKRTANDEVTIQSTDGIYIIGTFVKINDGAFPWNSNTSSLNNLLGREISSDKKVIKNSKPSDEFMK